MNTLQRCFHLALKKIAPLFCLGVVCSSSFLRAELPPSLSQDSPKYIVALNEKYRFLWFRVAKVGSSTIKVILRQENVGMPIMDDRFVFDRERYKDYFTFAFVRNPWARVVSCYFQKVANKNPKWEFYYGRCFDKGFDYFVDFIAEKDLHTADRHIRLQTSLVPENIDFIGRLENFDEDLGFVLERLGIDRKKIPRKNASSHKHYSHYYNDRTRDIIAQKYEKDILAYGYQFERE